MGDKPKMLVRMRVNVQFEMVVEVEDDSFSRAIATAKTKAEQEARDMIEKRDGEADTTRARLSSVAAVDAFGEWHRELDGGA